LSKQTPVLRLADWTNPTLPALPENSNHKNPCKRLTSILVLLVFWRICHIECLSLIFFFSSATHILNVFAANCKATQWRNLINTFVIEGRTLITASCDSFNWNSGLGRVVRGLKVRFELGMRKCWFWVINAGFNVGELYILEMLNLTKVNSRFWKCWI
jgi:hypothetical protein